MHYLKRTTAVYGLFILLAACALAFLGLAGYLALARYVEPPTAALLVGLVLLSVGLCIVLASRWRDRRRVHQGNNPVDDLEGLLEERIGGIPVDWIQRHPEHAVILTLGLGIAAGYSGSTRRVLRDVYDRYVEPRSECRR